MTEAKFQTAFTTWKKHHPFVNGQIGGAFELKISKTNSIPFTRLEDHQKTALLLAKQRELCYKIPDVGYDKKPCDMMCTAGNAFVVVMFYTKIGTKHFYIIDIDAWIREEKTSVRRSLTEEVASIIGERHELRFRN